VSREKSAGASGRWIDLAALPLLNLAAALLASGLVIRIVGEDPWAAMRILATGAFGSQEAIGYTLFFATNFIFTGLAVSVAYHAGLFNIGAEGQAYVGGLGVALVCLHLGHLPFWLLLPLAIGAAGLFGAAWAFIPGWLQARRGSHIVITTIMFNFLASGAMTWLLVNVLIKPGQQSPESPDFPQGSWLPTVPDMLSRVGVTVAASPLNLAFVIALVASAAVWLLLWRTRWGFAVRAAGQSAEAARYAGIDPSRVTVAAMMLSGALAGCLALNQLMGTEHRLVLDFPGGAGIVGIAVALMGRNHPLGIILASVLFGALYQGGSELAFDMPHVNRDMIVVIQGLVILFCGALEHLFRRPLTALLRRNG
jgi:general nucleoside transport system permease protein